MQALGAQAGGGARRREGRITFDNGSCLLRAEQDKLKVAVESLDEEGLDHLEGVVASHLERMSGKESLDIIWEN